MLLQQTSRDLPLNTARTKSSEQMLLPQFDMHKVEESLKINHRVFGGQPMSQKRIDEAMSDYMVFLRDHKASGAPDRFIVPSLDVDRVWHTHMCETKQYRDNCTEYFGKIIEHRSEICDGGLDP